MKPIVLSSYSKPLKIVFFGGVLFFFAMGAFSLWHAITDSPTNAAVGVFLVLAAGFGGMGWFGLRLLPFIHFSCAATPEGLYIYGRHSKEQFLPWHAISRVKNWQTLQVVDIYDLQGDRVLSVDYYISNFDFFYAQLVESVPVST